MTSDRLIAGRYRLTDPIGTGAMGVVWRATDVRLRRTVAVKQLLLGPGLTRSQAIEAKMRAMREGRIAARLHHPNAVTVFDVAEEDGQPWLVMEFVDAVSLAALMREKGILPPTEVARIGAKVAAAMAAAHKAGIVHRDVKPANILVAEDGTVKITDFGISRAIGDVTVTSTGFLAGTPAYLAPEVARGENPEPPSDVFALGSTLYAAVEGMPPFGEGDNPLALLHSVVRAQVPEPRNAGALGPVLMDLLAAEPGDRPTMEQATDRLQAVADGRATALIAPTKVLPAATNTAVVDSTAVTTVMATGSGKVSTANAGDETVHIDMTKDKPSARATAPGTPVPPAGTFAAKLAGQDGNRRQIALVALGLVAAVVIAVLVTMAVSRNTGENSPVANGTSTAVEPVNPTTASASGGATAPGGGDAGGNVAPTHGSGQAGSATHAPTTTPAPSTTLSARPSTTTAPPATTAVPPTNPPPAAAAVPSASSVTSFVQGYYGMLPGNVSAAWSKLSPGYQASTGGFNAYSQFWAGISSVSVGGVTATGENRAVVNLTYTLRNGQVTSESRWVQVDSSGGGLVIAASGT
ncbi:MAG: Non-specific serine/threonine protein kinase [Nocardia sp.]|uniref:serine/threonine-protein kinase n=1 Tax=Nocardia sp. TaxID=1821 RepID=UPI002605522C|nr:serine/threonine-protein kinase [Nocardia sp.]MCU1643160.1 Non-specific serine/threonine protein kinase [Nocardia sp.]